MKQAEAQETGKHDFDHVALPRFFTEDGNEIFPPYEMKVTRGKTGEAPQVALVSRLT